MVSVSVPGSHTRTRAPWPSSAGTTVRLGAARRSSLQGSYRTPSTAISASARPSAGPSPSSVRSSWTASPNWASLTAMVARSSGVGRPSVLAQWASALVSLGRQESP